MPSYHLDLIIGINYTHYFIHTTTTISHLPLIQHSAARLLTVSKKMGPYLTKSMSPAATCSPQTTPYYMFLLSALFQKLKTAPKFFEVLWSADSKSFKTFLKTHFLRKTFQG